MWTVADDGRHLLRDGRPDVLLADTQWAAIDRAPLDEFDKVVRLRHEQGFNAIMVSLLPIAGDRSGDDEAPPGPDDAGWLDRVDQIISTIRRHGLTPVVMLQWVTYVPDSWAARDAYVMDDAASLALLDAVVPRIRAFDPIWSLSGDDTFTSPASLPRYRLLAERLRELDPDHLVTAHTGGWINLPAELHELIDIVGYQSGHDGANWGENPQSWHRYLSRLRPRRPWLNLEPPYEGHGDGTGSFRYLAREVRTASWRSMLTGGGAGLGYGAHGLWSWHREGETFTSESWSGIPFPAPVAARFPGAEDVAWLRRMVLDHRLWRLDDRSDLVVRDSSGIIVGADPELSTLAVHAPQPFRFEVQVDDADYDVRGWDLTARREIEVSRRSGESGRLNIDTPHELADHLYLLTRR